MIVRNLLGRVAFSQTGLDGIDSRIDRTKNKGLDLGKALGIASGMLASLGLAAKALQFVDESLEFGRQLGQIQTLIPGSIARVRELKREIERMSVESGKSVKDLTDGLYQTISAFGDTADTVSILRTAQQAAVAGGSDVTTALNLLSAVTLAYGDASAQANVKVADLAFTAVKLGKTSLPELTAGIGQVTGAAVQLGITQEELFAIMGTAAGVTGPTAQAFTQFKATMTNLSAPTAALKKVYKELGITSIQAEISQRGLVPTLERIIAKTDRSAESVAKLFASDEARALIVPIVTKLQDRYTATLDATRKASGAFTEAHKAQTEGMGAAAFQADRLEQRTAALKRRIGDELTGALQDAKENALSFAAAIVNDLLPAYAKWRGENDRAVEGVDGLTLAAGILRGVINGFAFALDLAVTLMRSLGQAAYTTGQVLWRSAGGDFSGAVAAWGQGGAMQDALWRGFGERSERYGRAIWDPEGLRQRYEANQATMTGAELMRYRAEHGGANPVTRTTMTMNGDVNVTVPAGTSREQAEEVGDQAYQQFLQRAARQALETTPNPATAGAL